MKEIHIKRSELLTLLTKNLEIHNKIYEKSMEAFKKNYSKRILKLLNNAKNNKFEMELKLVKPESHKRDYEDAIHMVNLDNREIVILDSTEFAHYVLNRWTWLGYFYHSYISNCSSSSSSSTSSSSSYGDSKEISNYFKYKDGE